MQKILRVNTRTCETEYSEMPEKYRTFGKRGLLDRFLYDEVPPQCEPLGPSNKLVICTGTFAGTSLPVSGRVSIGGKSPLTGGIKECSVGGMLGPRMTEHAIKIISFEDKPEDNAGWKYLYIDAEGQASLLDASPYIGNGTYEFSEKMLDKYNREVGVAVIGPAGEMLYAIAAVMVSEFKTGHTCRAAGRGGMGALMGSKRIKGIVIEKAARKPGTEYADKELFDSARRRYTEINITSPQTQRLREIGSTNMMDVTGPLGYVPYRNFSGLPFSDEQKEFFTAQNWLDTINSYGGRNKVICHPGCIVMCSNVFNDRDGNFITAGFEYESVALLGPNLDIFDYYKTGKLDYLCDDIGLDTIDTGCIMGVCMEGGKIGWGDADAVEALFGEMRRGTEFGRLMGQGVEAVGRALGATRIPAVKHQGIAAYDPRGFRANGITYAVSTQGADHTWGMVPIPTVTDEQIPEMLFDAQVSSAFTGDIMCGFGNGPFRADPSILPDLYAGLYGGEWSQERLWDMGVETIKIERMFNEAAGFTDEDDRLPEFFRDPETQLEGGLPYFPYSDEHVQEKIKTIYTYKKKSSV